MREEGAGLLCDNTVVALENIVSMPVRGACASLLCDNCSNPGRCCTGFTIPLPGDLPTALHALVALATVVVATRDGRSFRAGALRPEDADSCEVGLPFMPLWQRPDGIWRYWCPNLVRGRCSIYEARPTLCSMYEAGSDGLCCMSSPTAAREAQDAPV